MPSSRLFGTDGIRDIAGRGNLSPEKIVKIGKVLGYLLRNEPHLFWTHPGSQHESGARIVTTRDTRASGHMIEGALRAGLLAAGANILAADILPTPVCSFLVGELDCSCGIVISASHNPNEYNGIKFFNAQGFKISTALEKRIEELVAEQDTADILAAPEIGTLEELPGAVDLYVDSTVERLINDIDLRGFKIVLDCANGAVTRTAPTIFNNLGADAYCINALPNGSNINVNSGALHPDLTAQTVKRLNARAGFSFDGDGDRVILVDEKGIERDGDYIMAICARHLKDTGSLPANTVVTTVMSNIGLELSLKEREIEVVRTKVGDRFVTEELLSRGAALGGEQSGHILFLDKCPTGDGVWTALMVLQIMNETGKSLSELSECMEKFPQVLLNIKVQSKPPLESIPEVKKALEDVNNQLAGKGRIVLRYSGTEPLARVMVEGPDHDTIQVMAQSIADVIANILG